MALTKIKADGLTADLIDETKLADNSIDSEHYNDGSIDNAHLADDAVGVAELSATGTASSSTFLRGDNSWATVTSTTINNNADNRVITGSGTVDTLNGESDLIFDGTKLGIGMTPGSGTGYLLQLDSGEAQTFMTFGNSGSGNGASNGFVVGNDTSRAYITQRENQPIFVATNNVDRLAIDADGNVGIGTTSPNSFSNYTTVTINGGSDGAGIDLELSDNNIYGRLFADTTGLQIQTAQSGDSIRFETGGSNVRARITDDGLCFGSDSAAANALDDYEEGTFTPSLIYQNTSGLTLTTNSAGGKYTKIGRVVYILGYINWDVSGSPINDNVGFGNFPFSTNTGEISAGNTRFVGNVTLYNTNAQSVTHQVLPYGTAACSLSLESEQGNRSNELGSGSGFQARFQFWYHTS